MANTFGIISGAGQGAASGAAGGAAGMAIGAGLGAINAAKGNEMTTAEMNDANQLMGMQAMWNNTQAQKTYELQRAMYDYTFNKNTAAEQVKRLKEAGLNPGLIYGMSGASGTQGTTGSAAAAGVGQGNTSDRAEKAAIGLQQQGMALQIAKLASEIKVNESVANANNAEAKTKDALRDVTVKLTENQTIKLEQEVINLGAEYGNTLADTMLKDAQSWKIGTDYLNDLARIGIEQGLLEIKGEELVLKGKEIEIAKKLAENDTIKAAAARISAEAATEGAEAAKTASGKVSVKGPLGLGIEGNPAKLAKLGIELLKMSPVGLLMK